ncbi:hypothetical protein Pint_29872 [Pistacia integerrima]|uniref:Uncharacterized protein n=1 Tax=Pistacia integerrima TaxID=434235 RepID=A0ACC0X0I2_9ROSI|nr:hypothetical protein Pint_29872 [Pistacia integerrima]
MEKTKVQSLLIVFLVLGLLSLQPVAARECLGHQSETSLTSNDFCDVGCVSSLCFNLMTKENLQKPGGKEKVEGCLDSCSTSYCAKN